MKLDVILPLYKTRPGWDTQIADAMINLNKNIGQYGELHLYLCNDGAPAKYYPEESLELISNSVEGRFHCLTYERNRGKGYSLRYLISRADGDYMVYTDGDFPFGHEAVANAFEALINGSDVVMGNRNNNYSKALSPFRKLLSCGLKTLNLLLCGLPSEIQDTQAGLKGFNRKGREIFLKTTVNSFVFDTEFILLAYKNGLKITPLDINLRPGLKLSAMGMKVMLRELFYFIKVLWRIRIKREYKK